MTLPETDLLRIRPWVDARNDSLPRRAVGQIRFKMDVDPRAVTIVECRRPWREDFEPEWTRFPVGSAALHEGPKGVGDLLAGPEPQVPPVRPGRAKPARHEAARRDRRRSDLHLLGLRDRRNRTCSDLNGGDRPRARHERHVAGVAAEDDHVIVGKTSNGCPHVGVGHSLACSSMDRCCHVRSRGVQ